MNITIIARCIYPMMSPRSFRAFELAKELSKTHTVFLYALLGDYDYSGIEKETGIIIRPLGISKCGNTDSTGKQNKSFFWKLVSHFLGRALQMPQMELLPMAKRIAVKAAEESDLIISIGRPFAIHFGVAFAKKKSDRFPVWISDCGDPFMGNSLYSPPKYFQRLEHLWGRLTDYITVPVEDAKYAYEESVRDKIAVIPQGFNLEDTGSSSYVPNEIPIFIFAGVVYEGYRDPGRFLMYLSSKKEDFRFVVYTKSIEYFEKYKQHLKDKLIINPFIPRNDLLNELRKADFLVNIENDTSVQAPSKLIDYAIANRPILSITTSFDNSLIVDEFLKGDYTHAMKEIDISKYDIKTVANQFLELASQNRPS